MRRRLLTYLLPLVAACGLAGGTPAAADEAPPSNTNAAYATNTTNGASVFQFAFAIRHVMGDVVDQTNAAVAYSSCTDCRTTAIAIEIVLVESDPKIFTPTNVAVAINENCNSCVTFAAAYQFVVQSNGPVRFTQDGWRQIREIRRQIEQLGASTLAPADLDAQLKTLMNQLQNVLRTELVPAENANNENENENNQSENTRGPPQGGNGGQSNSQSGQGSESTSQTTTTPATTTAATTTTATTTGAGTTTSTTTTTATTTTATTTTGTTTVATTTTTP